jgi:hypothetical protein
MRFTRPLASLAAASALTLCVAQQAQIQLSAYPTMSVADGRSTTTISAVVRDSRGNVVPDGTRVVFESTMGLFRENIVTTAQGVARAVLLAGGVPGVATISVKTVDAVSSPSTLQFEFKADRSMLSSAMEYIELVSPNYLEFIPDSRIIGAAAPNHGVSVRYRDISITADDVQINIPHYELRARKATLKIGKLTQNFDELYIKLNDHTGVGTTTFTAIPPAPMALLGRLPVFLSDDPESFKAIGQPVERFGLVNVAKESFTPALDTKDAYKLAFEDTGVYTSSVTAKRAIIFPQREIQFQKAEIMVTGNRVMQMPLYEVNLMQASQGSVMSSMINVNNNQVEINYAYYLSLKPGQTSLLRFRTGERYGRGVGASGGMFLDYELNWNRGDDMDGKFIFSGIGRKDWSVGVQQYMRVDDRTTAFGMVEMPANQSIYGSMNVSRVYNGYQVSLNGSMSRYLRGLNYDTHSYSLVAEKDPTKVGKLPVRMYLGFTAQQDSNSFLGSEQSAVGLRARLQSQPIRIDNRTTVYAGLSLAHLSGQNTISGLTTLGELNLRRQFNDRLSVSATYDYMRDGYNDRFLGRNRIGLETRYSSDRFLFNLLASKSLDINRVSLYGDMSLNVLGSWWVSGDYTLDRYLGFDYLDYSISLGYRISGREIGLVWSRSTKRIGLQILGAAF